MLEYNIFFFKFQLQISAALARTRTKTPWTKILTKINLNLCSIMVTIHMWSITMKIKTLSMELLQRIWKTKHRTRAASTKSRPGLLLTTPLTRNRINQKYQCWKQWLQPNYEEILHRMFWIQYFLEHFTNKSSISVI